MTSIGIACTVAIGVLALWLQRRVAHWSLVARLLGRDVAVERVKRAALAIALADVSGGVARGDLRLIGQALRVAIQIAEDDTDATIVRLGFKIPDPASRKRSS